MQTVKEDVVKQARLEARTTSRVKELIRHAAELEGRSVADFVIEHAREAAEDVIEKHSHIKLSVGDSAAFIEALLNPPAPHERLKRAARRHKELIKSK
jgi:uncharacterized protein (DUF1778 family)